jgi:hypothetical protein
MDHRSGAVLAQVRVDGKSNEISAFRPLLEQVDLTATVVTSDALYRIRYKASYSDLSVMPIGLVSRPVLAGHGGVRPRCRSRRSA